MSFQPSVYQQAIFDAIQNGTGDIVVNAVAGAGKTTTLVQAAKLIRGEGLFLAFNKHIADELGQRLTGTAMAAKTIHSVGNGMLTNHLGRLKKPMGNKYGKLIDQYLDYECPKLTPEERAKTRKIFQKLVDLCRLTMTDPTVPAQLDLMMLHYQIEDDDVAFIGTQKIIERGIAAAKNDKEIDFTDMIYLPVKWGLTPPQSKFVMVDECQDLSACQLAVAMKCRADGGRMVFVGDPAQSIMGFAGADNQSFRKIVVATNATELPLSICYRCPPNHLALAQEIVPHIAPIEGRADGILEYHGADDDWAKITKLVKEGDIILSRVTAPLVALCIKLIQNRVPARVKGRDIGSDLIALLEQVRKFAKGDFNFANMVKHIEAYEYKQLEILKQRGNNESRIQNLTDRCEAITACVEAFNAPTLEKLCEEIEGLFSDERVGVTLSTIHKTKGLEAERVFIIRPEKLPLRWANQQAWELEQEMNLMYVALTRSKCELHIMGDGISIPEAPSDPIQGAKAEVLVELPEVPELPKVLEVPVTPPEPIQETELAPQASIQASSDDQLPLLINIPKASQYTKTCTIAELLGLIDRIKHEHGLLQQVQVNIQVMI